ncbi:MAG: 5'-3' exonuclease H3TH domain-containing protein [Desulfomonilia bacterium]|jgi:protein Xni|uniref:Flap endonuclease Xni n=1 Tax=anaerobic digester metagenome TaxID=1263854 RepID=A0A485LVR9_9ZZZZ|nr:5'-3' exonuclease H3TH domain-containing protein [Pseudomonadota bacterium]HPD21049.1 5'-3' exonuclease H3TH domain-containing protein [Deltaproteobacteria bacterium]HPX17386.1 5'-3' exonuclease H3TH domain-containing protein [Deltaproteobacteria bacterium]HRS55298.1 5'-3' exonuclease H3TH domain-containing protein [Desulfomonilia bacterium]HRV35547.1 5'-3' exonuclease H3TH domain-containing protein [Desulfomonilia bacterium]
MSIHVLIIDALNLIRRVDAARRDHAGGSGSSVDACVQSLTRALNERAPSHAVCVFEGKGPSFRAALYPGYKAGRAPMPVDLEESLPMIRAAFLGMGVRSIEVDCVEADDIIATLAVKIEAGKLRTTILSTDKIFLQLLSDRIRVRDHFGKRELDQAYVFEKFQVHSTQLADLFALAGDPTNSIPGIPSVGRKTAARLLQEYGTLDNIISSASLIGGRLGRIIEERKDDAFLFRRLMLLKKDIDLGLNLMDFRLGR